MEEQAVDSGKRSQYGINLCLATLNRKVLDVLGLKDQRCRQKNCSEWLVYNVHNLHVGVEISDVERDFTNIKKGSKFQNGQRKSIDHHTW